MKATNKKQTKDKIFPIDSSARFYPFLATKKRQSSYRLSMTMAHTVDTAVLQQALQDIMPRFPSFCVTLHRGFAWYDLIRINGAPDVIAANVPPMEFLDFKANKGFMFRVSAFEKTICIDINHILSDGTGTLEFAKTFVARYCQLSGYPVDLSKVRDYKSKATVGELEDSFVKYYKHVHFRDIELKMMMGIPPLIIKGTPTENGLEQCEIYADIDEIKAKAKSYKTSITSLLCALLAQAVFTNYKGKRPIVMMVPINLRKAFPSDSLRNFVMFVRLIFKADGNYELGHLLSECDRDIKQGATEKSLRVALSTTVRAERTILFGYTPLFLKWIYLRIGKLILKSRQTILISNLGVIERPSEELLFYHFNVNVSPTCPVNLGVSSTGDTMVMTFTQCIKEDTIAKSFYELLNSQGIKTTYKYRG